MDSAIQAFHGPPAPPGAPQDLPLLPEALRRLGPEEVLVNEMFLSIQGESTWAGWPCFFIRLAGCHLRCGWCDTAYAFHEGSALPVRECIERARASGVSLVEVTGGEPLLQKATRLLLLGLADEGLQTLIETSGAVSIEGIDPRVVRIVDVKCPGSGMEAKNLPGIESSLRPRDELKFVLSSRADYEWARAWIQARKGRLPAGLPLNLSPVFEQLRPADLAKWILEDQLPVRMNLQLHKVIWDPGRRGV